MVSSGHADDERGDTALLGERSHDPAAFTELYTRHAGTVHAWLRARLEWAAGELTAEMFARAWLSARSSAMSGAGRRGGGCWGSRPTFWPAPPATIRIETRACKRLGLLVDVAQIAGCSRRWRIDVGMST